MTTVIRDALSSRSDFLSRRPDHSISPSPDQLEPRTTYRARKPSPGLSARLKALGFGLKDSSNKSASPSPVHERIGRIPEDQIRHIDLNHRANSISSSIIERRGRAWSAASGGYLTSEAGGGSFQDTAADDTRVVEVNHRRKSSAEPYRDIVMTEVAEPLGMESQKYRLPDHINGNGTKAMSDTRRAHIDRSPPSSDDSDDLPPPPLAKDTPPGGTAPAEFTNDASSSYFNPFGLPRAGSIYTLSRVSFANQLAQLTSLQLPDAESLSTKVSAIRTSKDASRALMGAAEQIRSWISKASEVIAGLDGEDDVEWAAAGGREGLEEVDNAITRFEELINVYVSAIEALQSRPDIATVSGDELRKVVLQVETILTEWEKTKNTLKVVKGSVVMAMEWEELWNTVLGDIGNEMDVLSRLVFEMEEKRHKSLMAEAAGDGVDIGELETIVEETPPPATRARANNRFSMQPAFPLGPTTPTTPAMAHDDSSLLALFARMQPLRASLDFLPMRLSVFHSRAEDIFPTACEELETRRGGLENSWKSLEKDAESLRRELGEDRWVLVFRGAGRQAQKMYESVERSVSKLREAVDAGAHLNNPATMGKKIESYEAKKMHYGPAIERVLSIIEKGVKDRLTVNGEILRLHSDMQRKWESLKDLMSELDVTLDEIQADKRNQQLRDSISSMVSNDRSTIASLDTPGSSPASSVVMSGLHGGLDHLTPSKNGKLRLGNKSGLPQPGAKRNVSMPSNPTQVPRKGLTSRLSTYGGGPPAKASPSPRQGSATPTGNRLPRPSAGSSDGRPRWNSSVNTAGTIVGHNFKPLSLTTPSPHAKTTPTLKHSTSSLPSYDSKIPLRSPLGIENTPSPAAENTPSRTSASRLALRGRLSSASPGPYSQQVLSSPAARPRNLQAQSSMSSLPMANRRASYQPMHSDPMSISSSPSRPPLTQRPASSLATNRRASLLPTPRGRQNSSISGRESPLAVAGAASALKRGNSQTSNNSKDSKGKEKTRWR